MIGVHQRHRMARAVGKRPTEIDRDGGLAGAALQVIFGRNTRDVVIAYQKKHGLTADGIAGPATSAKLSL
jgi:peptidoglycan hydrolase-like protein with peptidoglycan-binding domain